jgi:hypothetical protein
MTEKLARGIYQEEKFGRSSCCVRHNTTLYSNYYYYSCTYSQVMFLSTTIYNPFCDFIRLPIGYGLPETNAKTRGYNRFQLETSIAEPQHKIPPSSNPRVILNQGTQTILKAMAFQFR